MANTAPRTDDSKTGRASAGGRRDQVLEIAARLFAERGFRNTTVRDIAEEAGILSGSLYYHFDSKESMVDDILKSFQDELFEKYDHVMEGDQGAKSKLESIVRLTFQAIDEHGLEVAIYQNELSYLGTIPRFKYLVDRNVQSRHMWTSLLDAGVKSGELRPDLNVELAFKFIRDTVWAAVRWYRHGGPMTHDEVADQYLVILLDGVVA